MPSHIWLSLKTDLDDVLFLHNYIEFSTVIRKKCFEKISVGI